MRIKPIETYYAGRYFRSRLEARWAVFFDAIQTGWEYEQLGFEVEGERYLPDFYIPLWVSHVEIKPKHMAIIDRKRIERLMAKWQNDDDDLILIRGEPAKGQYGVWTNDATMTQPGVFMRCRSCMGLCLVFENGWGEIGEHWCIENERAPCDDDGLDGAYRTAMSYRFDHIEAHKLTGEHRRKVAGI